MKCAVLLLLACVPLVAIADERILDYHSDIVVQQSGWIEVTEIIRVRAEGRQIRRGIYRDYPTSYKDKLGNSVEVDYEPLAVLRNDQREDFHSERYANGVRTYFGSADRLLNRGEHTYTYRYRAGRMLGFFDSHDELYWNVTGNGWAFPIDHASATVTFDFDLGSGEIAVNGYTGPQGYDGSDYQANSRNGASAHFETTKPLPAGSGLTIVVTWPKGFVSEPTAIDKVGWLLSDNRNFLVALFGFFALFAYYVPVWKKHGKDPESGVVFARYEPPRGFSPASLRYIDNMYYDNTVMTAAIVNLAVKGYLKITNAGKTHSLEMTIPGDNAPRLAAGERELYDGLFRRGQHIVLEDENHEVLGQAKRAHQASLKSDYASRYFAINGMLSLPGIVIALVASIIALNTGAGATFFVVATIIAMVLVVAVFAYLMMRPTSLGRKVLDEMSGFREYLEVAEKDEMNLRNPPKKTPQLFEKYLPFALAIGVEQAWAEKFTRVLASVRDASGDAYHPAWYSGNWNNLSLATTANSLSSELGAAISSSVTPPGSSSGGGGGSSGGGGGGGGGGGW